MDEIFDNFQETSPRLYDLVFGTCDENLPAGLLDSVEKTSHLLLKQAVAFAAGLSGVSAHRWQETMQELDVEIVSYCSCGFLCSFHSFFSLKKSPRFSEIELIFFMIDW